MKKVTIIFGSSTGNTEKIAQTIANKLGGEIKIIDVAKATTKDVNESDTLLLGASTWGYGDLQDDWEDFLPKLEHCELKGKVVALFGLGDSESYPDTFTNAMGLIHNTIAPMGCTIIGKVSTEGYTFDDSLAVEDNEFVGLALNEDNESDLTEERITHWVEALKKEL